MKKKRQRLPDGVRVCPEAAECLQRALDALASGLVVAAWAWTERARAELDRMTDGPTGADSAQE